MRREPQGLWWGPKIVQASPFNKILKVMEFVRGKNKLLISSQGKKKEKNMPKRSQINWRRARASRASPCLDVRSPRPSCHCPPRPYGSHKLLGPVKAAPIWGWGGPGPLTCGVPALHLQQERMGPVLSSTSSTKLASVHPLGGQEAWILPTWPGKVWSNGSNRFHVQDMHRQHCH